MSDMPDMKLDGDNFRVQKCKNEFGARTKPHPFYIHTGNNKIQSEILNSI